MPSVEWTRGTESLSDVGEFGAIDRLAAALERRRVQVRAPAAPPGSLGIGDDAAAWPHPRGVALGTTDALVEGTHFDLALTTWHDLGWKALAVNLSDIAAMGGHPRCALVTVGLRQDTLMGDAEALYEGMAELAGAAAVRVMGGDTVAVRHEQFINVAVWGNARQFGGMPTLLTRSGAQVGDLIAVTGQLGASAAGLHLLQRREGAGDAGFDVLRAAHLRPRPQLVAGRRLLGAGVRIAIDVSDGLLADLEKVCQASDTAAVVWARCLPMPDVVAQRFAGQALGWAAAGGEDYELLFVAPPRVMPRARASLQRAGVQSTVIGEVVSGPAGRVQLLDEHGREVAVPRRGWEHFAAGDRSKVARARSS